MMRAMFSNDFMIKDKFKSQHLLDLLRFLIDNYL